MKLVRNNVFETNSSSTHSISICRYEKPQENNQDIKVNEEEKKEYN